MPTKLDYPLLKRVGTRIRKARRTKQLSQETVALAAGLDRSFVSGMERGEHNIFLLALAKLARVLNVRMAALLENE